MFSTEKRPMQIRNLILSLLLAATVTAFGSVEFNRDVRPILSDKCFGCHGPDSGHRKAGLRLDQREAATKATKSGDVPITPGKPELSEIITRVLSSDKDEIMPPPEAKMSPLSEQEINTLKKWIREGAEYQPLWSFMPPTQHWPAHKSLSDTIDSLVRAKLKARNIVPRPVAARETLLRRIFLDLTGLPPTPEDVRSFLADSSAGAYERTVDRLLKSPAFGEKWASDWLDISRYADSYGFQVDRDRNVWQWRDWVVSALNRNLPFNDFVTWQLAGDLLPNPTDEQLLATAFNRLHQQEAEGGSVEEEYRVEYISDRVQTFATAFLGLTFECAKCHDHKFDPISQKEFYQMFAFFDDIDEAGLYSFYSSDAPTPSARLLSADAKVKLQELDEAIKRAESAVAEQTASAHQGFASWLQERPQQLPIANEIGRFQMGSLQDKKLPNLIDTSKPAPLGGANKPAKGHTHSSVAVQLTGDDELTLPVGNFDRSDPFTISLWIQSPDIQERAVLLHRTKAWTDSASRGFELLLENGFLKWSLIRFWPGDAASIRSTIPVQPGQWTHVSITSDGSGKASGLQIFIDGSLSPVEVIKDNLSREINPSKDNITIGARNRDRGFKNGLVEDVRVFDRRLSAFELHALRFPEEADTLWKKPLKTLSDRELNALRETFLSSNPPEPLKKAASELKTARVAFTTFLESQPEIPVMRDLPAPKKAFVLFRGQYDQRRDEVFADTPASLPPFPQDAPRTRLGLARWLTSPDHPLLARVTANRFWQALFGRGLVRTAEDFGSQGAQPEYQDVLDALALDFAKHGWDTKALLKSIVMSETYRQQSTADPQLVADDPDNTLLGRGPRFRLPAESVRDTFLTASGLLSTKLGGAPVNPYEASEAFRPTAADKGEGSLRRSLYTRWRRTSPPPAMMAFDASRRAVCSAKRERTNTPLQALVLLNGPQYVEAARVLGSRLHRESQGKIDKMIEEAFLTCLSRFPDATERDITAQLYQEQLAYFQAHPEDASSLLKVGQATPDASIPPAEAAAATILAQTLLNHDGSVVKQ